MSITSLYASTNNRRWKHYVLRSSVRLSVRSPIVRCPSVHVPRYLSTYWKDFNETRQKSSSKWVSLKSPRSEVRPSAIMTEECISTVWRRDGRFRFKLREKCKTSSRRDARMPSTALPRTQLTRAHTTTRLPSL